MKASSNSNSKPSKWYCAFTSLEETSKAPHILVSLSIALIVSGGFLVALNYSGYLGKLNVHLPRVLVVFKPSLNFLNFTPEDCRQYIESVTFIQKPGGWQKEDGLGTWNSSDIEDADEEGKDGYEHLGLRISAASASTKPYISSGSAPCVTTDESGQATSVGKPVQQLHMLMCVKTAGSWVQSDTEPQESIPKRKESSLESDDVNLLSVKVEGLQAFLGNLSGGVTLDQDEQHPEEELQEQVLSKCPVSETLEPGDCGTEQSNTEAMEGHGQTDCSQSEEEEEEEEAYHGYLTR